jgi:hypothetical protein
LFGWYVLCGIPLAPSKTLNVPHALYKNQWLS